MKLRVEQAPYKLCLETIANELRIGIVQSLKDGPKTVSQLQRELNVEQSRLSHSLKLLRDCNHVDVKREGKQRVYSLKPYALEVPVKEGKASVFDIFDNHFQKRCDCHCRRMG